MTYEQFSLIIQLWIGLAVMIFFLLLFITAPYGRHTKTSWGPLIDNKVGWIIMEAVALFVVFYFVFTGTNKQSLSNIIMISLFAVHYLNRSLIFPFRLKTKGKKMPVVIMLMGVTFNIVSGFTIGYYFGNFKVYDNSWLSSLPFIAGIIIFILGMLINWQSDEILLQLREPGETGYKIPQGKMFKYVSCPNLLGEVIEWAGYALLTYSLPALGFFIWTFANLMPRAIAHHKWYLEKFPDYPKDRKAFIPFIY